MPLVGSRCGPHNGRVDRPRVEGVLEEHAGGGGHRLQGPARRPPVALHGGGDPSPEHDVRRPHRRAIDRQHRSVRASAFGVVLVAATILAGCSPSSSGDAQTSAGPSPQPSTGAEGTPDPAAGGPVVLPDGRQLFVRCTGAGAPTVILEGGDLDTSGSYSFAERDIAAVTRTCVYDRANLGRSDPDPGPRQLSDLVGDLEGWIDASGETGPFVLVGTSGGGYITAGSGSTRSSSIAESATMATHTGPRPLPWDWTLHDRPSPSTPAETVKDVRNSETSKPTPTTNRPWKHPRTVHAFSRFVHTRTKMCV